MKQKRYAVFLGGHDLEMVTIAALLREVQSDGAARIAEIHDDGLRWGARASVYGERIEAAAKAGLIPVLIELATDLPLPHGVIDIDHHGARVAEPCALRQVFNLLDLPEEAWTRDFTLVEANDVGHVAAMRRLGASDTEIADIRLRDRRAQGITPEEEQAGLAALRDLRVEAGGTLLFVRLPHGRTATVTDPLALAGDTRDLLALTPQTTEFYGNGSRIARLDTAFPGGWRGGELPVRGFWGLPRQLPHDSVISAITG